MKRQFVPSATALLRACLIYGLTATITSSATVAADGNATAATALTFTQKSVETGTSQITADQQGLKIENLSRGTVILSRPPRWEVIVARPKDKIYCTVPLETWCHSSERLMLICAGCWDDDWSHMPTKSCSFSGFPGHRYEYNHGLQRLHSDPLVSGEIADQRRIKTKTEMTVVNSNLPLPARRILERFSGTPHLSGIPVECKVYYADGFSEDRFQSTKLKKQSTTSTFCLANGYHLVDLSKLALSSGERSDFDDLARDMDIGRAFGAEKKQK
jgi:hypothetical protein